MKLINEKASLRTETRAKRKAMEPAARATAQEALTERLLKLPALKRAHTIGAYYAVGSEASLQDVVEALRASTQPYLIAYPIVVSEEIMCFLRVDPLDDLSSFAEPKRIVSGIDAKHLVEASGMDVLLVPGIAFDESCHRLGQGGGYYDRYLTQVRGDCLTVGIAFDEQIVEQVPTDSHDQRVDYVVTPTRVIAP